MAGCCDNDWKKGRIDFERESFALLRSMPPILELDPCILHTYSKEEHPPYGAVAVMVKSGLGALRQIAAIDDSGVDRVAEAACSRNSSHGAYFLAFNDTPLVKWQGSGCPTCEHLLQTGSRTDEQAEEFARVVNSLEVTEVQTSPEACVRKLAPILKLFDPGIYLVALHDLVPTNGEGTFFWSSFKSLQESDGLLGELFGEEFLDFHSPEFLVATQPPFAWSVASHRRATDAYQRLPGIAFYLGGCMAALLDGHHRALQATIAEARFACLTIFQASYTNQAWEQLRNGNHEPVACEDIWDNPIVYFPERLELPLAELSPEVRNWIALRAQLGNQRYIETIPFSMGHST